jgi:hypothetical protein
MENPMAYKLPALALAAVVGAFATGASAQTLGDRVDSGQMSEAAFQQLIVGTGLSAQDARGLTLDEIVAIRWQDD